MLPQTFPRTPINPLQGEASFQTSFQLPSVAKGITPGHTANPYTNPQMANKLAAVHTKLTHLLLEKAAADSPSGAAPSSPNPSIGGGEAAASPPTPSVGGGPIGGSAGGGGGGGVQTNWNNAATNAYNTASNWVSGGGGVTTPQAAATAAGGQHKAPSLYDKGLQWGKDMANLPQTMRDSASDAARTEVGNQFSKYTKGFSDNPMMTLAGLGLTGSGMGAAGLPLLGLLGMGYGDKMQEYAGQAGSGIQEWLSQYMGSGNNPQQ